MTDRPRARSSNYPKPFLILVTPGDPEGIGPEIVWKSLRLTRYAEDPSFQLVCVGAREGFTTLGIPDSRIFGIDERFFHGPPRRPPRGAIALLPAPSRMPRRPSSPSRARSLAGFQAGWSIQTATRLIQGGQAHALVTGPISKDRLQRGGYPYSGHTDFLADLCGTRQVTMMLANRELRVTLVTVHIALQDVPGAVTREKLRVTIRQTAESLRSWFGIRHPRIAVAALNPHAGENGLFGDQERRVLLPEIRFLQRSARSAGYSIDGPHPADTFFAKHRLASPADRHDAVVCMYHDQGLIPVKLLDFKNTVNVTLGLPIVRTSVDHGVAFDIARRNKADPSSLRAAIDLAVEILNRQRK